VDGATNNIGSTRGDNNNFFRFVSFDLALIRELTPELDSLGNIRPYLESACKLYSEADAGPGAEAGAGFRDYKNYFGSTCVAASVRPGSGLSSTDLPVNSTLVPCIYLSSLERHPHGSSFGEASKGGRHL